MVKSLQASLRDPLRDFSGWLFRLSKEDPSGAPESDP